MFQCEIDFTFTAAQIAYADQDVEVPMAQRKTLRSLERPVLISALASLVAALALGALVHEIMWSHVAHDEAAAAPVKQPAPRVHVSSRTLAA